MAQSESRKDGTYTVNQFCKSHNISRSMFYKQLKLGEGPRLMAVGRRRMISFEAAADWRQQMERP